MFSLCKQTLPATGVEFAIKCKFFNNLENSLVVGGANVIRVYRIIPDVALNSAEKFTGLLIFAVNWSNLTHQNISIFRYTSTKDEIWMHGNLPIVRHNHVPSSCISQQFSARCTAHQLPGGKVVGRSARSWLVWAENPLVALLRRGRCEVWLDGKS